MFEIRISNIEYRNKFKIQNLNRIKHSDFDIVSYFGFRISDFH